MNIANQVADIGNTNAATPPAVQLNVLNKARHAEAAAVLPLLGAAVQASRQIQASVSNPAHLGQNVDINV